MSKCETCGAPVNLAPDGDPRYDHAKVRGYLLELHSLRTRVMKFELRELELKADAERYRWMIDGHGYFFEEEGLSGAYHTKEEMDAAVDKYRLEQG